MTERRRTLLACAGVISACLVAAGSAGFAEERVTDASIDHTLHRSHRVMGALRGRLHGILDAFLTGDSESIREQAEHIDARMLEVSRQLPPEPGTEATQWRLMAEIVQQAKLLHQRAAAGDYRAAFINYVSLTNRCIECHQVRRDWGTFPGSKAGAEELPEDQQAESE